MRNWAHDILSLLLLLALVGLLGYRYHQVAGRLFEPYPADVNAVAVNDQHGVVTASEKSLFVWRDEVFLAKLRGHTGLIKSVAFSADGQLFASGGLDKTITIWSWRRQQPLRTLTHLTGGVIKVAFDTSGRYLLSNSYDAPLQVWDWQQGKVVREFSQPTRAFAVSSHNVLAYTDTLGMLTLVDLTSGNRLAATQQYASALAFHPAGSLLVVYDERRQCFRFLDVRTSAPIAALVDESRGNFSTIKFSPDGNYLAVARGGGDIAIWDWPHHSLRQTLHGPALYAIEDMAFIKTGVLLSASGYRSVQLWDWQKGVLKARQGDTYAAGYLATALPVLVWLTLACSFWAVARSKQHSFSSFTILAILAGCSLGLVLLLWLLRSSLTKTAWKTAWLLLGLAGLGFLSPYLVPLTFLLLPVGLFFSYLALLAQPRDANAAVPALVSLLLLGISGLYLVSLAERS
jgi:hypothetical protein